MGFDDSCEETFASLFLLICKFVDIKVYLRGATPKFIGRVPIRRSTGTLAASSLNSGRKRHIDEIRALVVILLLLSKLFLLITK